MAEKLLRIKAFLIVSVIVPFAVASILLGWSSYPCIVGELALWMTHNRATTQAFVQIIATLVSACQIYTISSLIRFWFSTRLPRTPASLDTLKLLEAMTTARLDLDVSGRAILLLIAYLSLIRVPAAVWAGALTPIAATQNVIVPFTIPAYSNLTAYLWTYECFPGGSCDAAVTGVSTSMGTFSYIPWKDKTGLLLNAVSEASSTNSSEEPLHRKFDNSGYTYHGRSYGVASTVGLVPDPIYQNWTDNLVSYRYQEAGYTSSVQCIYNETANLTLTSMGAFNDLPPGSWSPVGYWPSGSLPTGEWDGYPTWSMMFNGTVFAIAAVRNSTHYMYGLLGGAYNDAFNGIQCEVEFLPKSFSVEVNTRNKSVVVDTVGATDEIVGYISWNESITDYAFLQPMYVAQTLNTMYIGVLAQAFGQNVDNVRQRNGHVNATEEDYLTGVAEGFQVLLDYFLGSIAAAQVMASNDTQVVMAGVGLQAMQIGEGRFIWGVFGICVAILLVTIVDAVRTRFWTRLPLFNPLDLKSVVLGLTSGMSSYNTELNKDLELWDGDPSDRTVGAFKVASSVGRPILIFADTPGLATPNVTGNEGLPLLLRSCEGTR